MLHLRPIRLGKARGYFFMHWSDVNVFSFQRVNLSFGNLEIVDMRFRY